MVILTEDTTSGFILISEICKLPGFINYKVYNSSYGGDINHGGNTRLFNALQNLYRDGKIDKSDKVIIIFDQLIPTEPRMIEDLRILNLNIERCKSFLKKRKIQYKLSDITCIEEVILSFDYLIDWCQIEANQIDSFTLEMTKNLQGNKCKVDKAFYIKRLSHYTKFNIRTVEKMLKLVLSKITVCGHFNTFKIDSTVGGCWLNDCVDMRNRLTNTQKALCKKCGCIRMGKQKNSKYENRLKQLFLYSAFSELLR